MKTLFFALFLFSASAHAADLVCLLKVPNDDQIGDAWKQEYSVTIENLRNADGELSAYFRPIWLETRLATLRIDFDKASFPGDESTLTLAVKGKGEVGSANSMIPDLQGKLTAFRATASAAFGQKVIKLTASLVDFDKETSQGLHYSLRCTNK